MKNKQQPLLSPQSYIRTKARNLPIYASYINQNWKETGLATIIVVRKHTVEKYTLGVFIVDLLAYGTKDSFFRFSIEKHELEDMVDKPSYGLILTDYALVHNIIYGANAFAEDNGFKICREFNLTQNLLEEDTEDIELIDIAFGQDAAAFLKLGEEGEEFEEKITEGDETDWDEFEELKDDE
ncbi:MAG: hypothetical protein WCH34_02975 [Bacteroidota bacterium]